MGAPLVIIDYDAGNLRNVQKAVEHLGGSARIVRRPEDLEGAGGMILPGVGSFFDGMTALRELGLAEEIQKRAGTGGVPLLGICLGMQLLAEEGVEGGEAKGLGLLPMKVRRLDVGGSGLRLPHIGWDDIVPKEGSRLLAGVPSGADLYFVHSYHVVCGDPSIIAATCDYGREFTAAVERGTIMAAQFHPEKSQRFGLQILENFLRTCAGGAQC